MIELLLHTPAPIRHILAVGEMLELGPASAELHRQAGRAAAEAGELTWIIAVQGNAEVLFKARSKAAILRKVRNFLRRPRRLANSWRTW